MLDTQLLQDRWKSVIAGSSLPPTRKNLLETVTTLSNLERTLVGVVVTSSPMVGLVRTAIRMDETYFYQGLSGALEKPVTDIVLLPR